MKAITRRERAEAEAKKFGRRDELLGHDQPPDGFEYLWQTFFDVRQGASQGFDGASLSWRDIEAYQNVTGSRLTAWEAEAIMAMDGALRAGLAEDTATS